MSISQWLTEGLNWAQILSSPDTRLMSTDQIKEYSRWLKKTIKLHKDAKVYPQQESQKSVCIDEGYLINLEKNPPQSYEDQFKKCDLPTPSALLLAIHSLGFGLWNKNHFPLNANDSSTKNLQALLAQWIHCIPLMSVQSILVFCQKDSLGTIGKKRKTQNDPSALKINTLGQPIPSNIHLTEFLEWQTAKYGQWEMVKPLLDCRSINRAPYHGTEHPLEWLMVVKDPQLIAQVQKTFSWDVLNPEAGQKMLQKMIALRELKFLDILLHKVHELGSQKISFDCAVKVYTHVHPQLIEQLQLAPVLDKLLTDQPISSMDLQKDLQFFKGKDLTNKSSFKESLKDLFQASKQSIQNHKIFSEALWLHYHTEGKTLIAKDKKEIVPSLRRL